MWKNAFKNGRANYITGYHPAFMAGKALKRAFRSRPFFVESTALMAGFCSGYFRRVPQLSKRVVIRYLRQQQMRRMLFRPSIYT
jgi:poly-beta-1,6-N-acetyl-D-glucosamine synthase